MRSGAATILAALALGAGGVEPTRAASSLRVLTYNIHWASPTRADDGHDLGRVELGLVVADIRRSRADVVGLQEAQVYRRGARVFSEPLRIARALGWARGGTGAHVLFAPGHPPAPWCIRRDGSSVIRRLAGRAWRCTEHGNALISRFALEQEQRVNLVHPDRYEGRTLIGATLAGRGLRVYTTHLERDANVGACQLAQIAGMGLGSRPAVLAADLNLGPERVPDAPRCDGVPPQPLDLLERAGFTGVADSVNTYPAYSPRQTIDHVLSTRGIARLGARRLGNCRLGVCSSDHRPFVASLRLP